MALNPDVSLDLAWEVIDLCRDNPETTARFMLSGKKSLAAMKKVVSEVEHIWFGNFTNRNGQCSENSRPILIEWTKKHYDIGIFAVLKDPYMGPIIRWTLSSVKQLIFDITDPLPTDITDLLLKNSNFTHLYVSCDSLPQAKLLIEAKRFKYIKISYTPIEDVKDTHIDTEVLGCCEVPLEKILKVESIKTNSLYIDYDGEKQDFCSGLREIDVSPNFQSLKELQLFINDIYLFFRPEEVREFLELLTTKLVNLTTIELSFFEFSDKMVYNEEEGSLIVPFNLSEAFIGYKHELTNYNGQANIEINHRVDFKVVYNTPENTIKNFLENHEKQYPDFEYHPNIDDDDRFWFSKSKSKKPRDIQYQLTSGAVSVDMSKLRQKRQDYRNFGRNPPGMISGGNNDDQDPYNQGSPQTVNFASPQGNSQFSRKIVRPAPTASKPVLNNVQNPRRPQIPRPQVYNPKFPQKPSFRPPNSHQRNSVNNQVSRPLVPSPEGTGLQEHQATKYYYPPRMPLPLPECFHNPTGYVCCNKHLNDLIVDTYTQLAAKPKFHTCNINAIAQHLQMNAEKRFNTSFETIAGFEDFAQKIHFNGNLACKVEINGSYMLAYATVRNVAAVLPEENLIGPQQERPLHHISRRHTMFI